MLDLSNIPDEVLKARGMYSTVRKEHEAQLRKLQELCQDTITKVTKLFQAAQRQPFSSELLTTTYCEVQLHVRSVGESIDRVASLNLQKAELKPQAWEE